jgi:hypothetical protein
MSSLKGRKGKQRSRESIVKGVMELGDRNRVHTHQFFGSDPLITVGTPYLYTPHVGTQPTMD